MTYSPTAYEAGLWHWLDSVVGSTVDDIRYANQPFAVGGKTVVTIQVLQVTQEMTPSRRLTVIGRREEIESAYTGTVSVQVFGPNHRAIAQTIVRSLWRDDIGRTNTANGVEVRGEIGGIQDLSALIATDYLARSGVDFTFSFREVWTADEASAAITAAAATGMGGTAFVEQSKRIAAALRGESTVTVGASVSMTASATIEGASAVSVGATVRVPVAVQCQGASSVTVGAVARRIAEATCTGASTVLAGGMVRRLAKVSPIIGASGVEARAEVAHNMEHIKRIFGVDDILLLVAGDGAGGLTPYYAAPGFVETFNSVDDNVIPPVTDSFSQNGVEVGVSSGARYINFSTPLVETFSFGMFVGKCTNDSGIIARINNMYLYSMSAAERLMVRDAKAGINYSSGAGFALYDAPDFWIMEGDKGAQQMHLHAAGGKFTVNEYPEDMTLLEAAMGRVSGNEIYDVQFYVLLNRLMTDPEIAAVRALL